jgi:uncharacterized protein
MSVCDQREVARRLIEARPILPPPVPTLPREPFIYKFWGTLIWSVLFVAVMPIGAAVSGVLAALLYHLLYGFHFLASEETRRAFLDSGIVTAAMAIVAIVAGLLVLVGAIRLARQSPADYLALRWPSARHAAIGLGATVLLMVLLEVAAALIGLPRTPKVLIDWIRAAREHHAVGFFALAVVVVAPIIEEIMFRGFIYRGFAASRLGIVGAVALSSLIFTALHVQYDLIVLCGLMVMALLLGTMRAISGSTLLTISMHALNNGVAMLELLWLS